MIYQDTANGLEATGRQIINGYRTLDDFVSKTSREVLESLMNLHSETSPESTHVVVSRQSMHRHLITITQTIAAMKKTGVQLGLAMATGNYNHVEYQGVQFPTPKPKELHMLHFAETTPSGSNDSSWGDIPRQLNKKELAKAEDNQEKRPTSEETHEPKQGLLMQWSTNTYVRKATNIFRTKDDSQEASSTEANHSSEDSGKQPSDQRLLHAKSSESCLEIVLATSEDKDDEGLTILQEDIQNVYDPADIVSGINTTASPVLTPAQFAELMNELHHGESCLLYTSPSPRDGLLSRMPSSA